MVEFGNRNAKGCKDERSVISMTKHKIAYLQLISLKVKL